MKTKDTVAMTSSAPAQFQPLAIVGMGCLFPKAENLGAYWANIKNGVDAITEIPSTHWPVEDYFNPDQKAPDRTYGRRGGFISPVAFNPLTYNIPPNTMEAIDTSQLLGLVAAHQALTDAGYGPEKSYNRERVSVILGVTGALELVIPLGARLGHPLWRAALNEAGVEESVAEDVIARIGDSYVPWQENSFPGLLGNVVAGRISKQFDLGGTNCVVDAACASSLSAMHLAAMELACGRADMVVSGGVDTFNDIFMYMCFSKTPALSPTGNAKPFDADADGTILGEGLGIMVLKRLADAERDGDRIYAVVKGIGSSSDGKGDAIYAPSAGGQKKALLEAYRQAGVTPESIQLVEGHGTGTKVGDAVEVSALRAVYGDAELPWCALGSVKSQIGHAKAAAGAAGIIKAALALHHKVLPPTIKVSRPVTEVTAGRTPFYLNTTRRPWLPLDGGPRRAGVSAFGFGGSNFHCVLEEYRREKAVADWDGDVQIVAFSGENPAALKDVLAGITAEVTWNELRRLAAVSRATFRGEAPCRLALVIERGKTNLGTLLAGARSMLSREKQPKSWSTPDGAYFSTGAAPGKLGCIFPGQGAQYTGMLRDLACHFPEMLAVLGEADTAYSLEPATAGRLSDLIYPPTAFDDATRDDQDKALRATDVAQPAIGAVSLGALQVLAGFGIAPEAAAGHSYGELTALCAAGRFDAEALHLVSRLRGQLMAEGDGDKGGMLAVSAPLETVAEILRDEKLDLVLANKNAPAQAVLSGRSGDIERAAKLLAARNLPCKPLPVAAAFHSPLVAEASAPFLARLEGIPFASSRIPVFSNTTADEYPDDAGEARRLLASQLAAPVEFVEEIENMFRAGVRTFLEVGPGARLTGLVKSILGDREYEAFAIDASAGKRSGLTDLARSLAHLAVLGYGVKLPAWDAGFRDDERPADGKKPAMTISLCGANYVKPRAKRASALPAPARVSAPVEQPAVPGNRTAVDPAPVASAAAPVSSLHPDSVAGLLRLTQDNMAAMQRLQEQTAQLHRQFLEGQETSGRTFQLLLEQQQLLLSGGLSSGAAGISVAPQPLPPRVHPVPAVSFQAAPPAPVAMPLREVVAAPAPVLSEERTATVLFQVISDKTGYPVEMLNLDMALDADLGIDSIKRVEILAALQERLPEAPAVTPEELTTLQTLRQIVDHLGLVPEPVSPRSHVAPLPPSIAARSGETVTSTLLAVISDKTGYPVEMLDLDMSLDADLGIDSIKRVEILAALQERLPEAPAVTPEELTTLQTLRQIVDHLGQGNAGTQRLASPTHPQSATPGAALGAETVTAALMAVISDKTGYPVEMLELDMSLDADLGIDSIKRVEILAALQERLPEAPAVTPKELTSLQTLRQIVDHLGVENVVAQSSASPAPSLSAAPGTALSTETVTTTLLSVISDKTGYPVEMLELDMSLDADLGIDSIKRVEILAAIQERLPEAPAVTPEEQNSLHTLRQIVAHLSGGVGRGEAASSTAEPIPVSDPAVLETFGAGASSGSGGWAERSVLTAVRLSEGETRQSVDVAQDAEIWITDDGAGLAGAVAERLSGSGRLARVITLADPGKLDVPERLGGLLLLPPATGTEHATLLAAFRLLKESGAALRRAAEKGGAFMVTVSRLDGRFGVVAGTLLADPLSGGLAGLAKTARHEWPGVSCKALDLAGDLGDNGATAEALIAELFMSGPVEMGLSASGRYTLELVPAQVAGDSPVLPLAAGDLVVVSGGARGVTAEVAVALAGSCRPTLVLLGRSSAPTVEPSWLAPLGDEASIKRGLMERAVPGTTPKQIEEDYRALSANREMLRTLARIEATGATAVYRAVDIRDPHAVAAIMAEVRRSYGPVRGLIHGAGVIADRLIHDKTAEQFETVYGTKVDGLLSLLAGLQDDDLRFMALFSSSTGRFGRTGQVDYAVANEVLNKLAQREARLRPACRVTAINWGPWDGGMVTPGLKKVFAGEGVEVIGLAAGADCLLREISLPPGEAVETVVLGKSGVAGGAKAAPGDALTEAVSLELTVEKYPFLRSHVMNGRAVLPLAMVAEWLAHGALHGNPGLRFHGFDDLRIFKGVIFDENSPCTVRIMAGKAVKREAFHLVPVELRGLGSGGENILHARGEIVLAARLPEGIRAITDQALGSYPFGDDEIYTDGRLFHGPVFQGIEHVSGCGPEGIKALVKAAPAPSRWIASPLRTSWLTDPLALDGSFQMMILWSFERFGAGSLPCFAGRYRQFQEQFPKDGTEVVIRVTRESVHGATAAMEYLDRQTGKLIARLEGYECVIDASLREAFRKNYLPPETALERGAA